MRRFSASDIVLKVLGLLLLAAAVLKGHELLTVPTANKDLWFWRPFLIFQVEFELVLGIWLLSGVFKRLAWLASLVCFSLFCCVTLYKGLTGAASCGCLGQIHVNPWITLVAVDLPAALALVGLRPAFLADTMMTTPRLRAGVSLALLLALGVPSGIAMVQQEPAQLSQNGFTVDVNAIRNRHVLLDPESWAGAPFPLFEYIDIGDRLRSGRWLLILYRQDCRECQEAVPRYKEMAKEVIRRDTQLAFIAIPPYGGDSIEEDPLYSVGRLSGTKRWIVMTPVVTVLEGGRVVFCVEGREPDVESLLQLLSSTPRVRSPDKAARIATSTGEDSG